MELKPGLVMQDFKEFEIGTGNRLDPTNTLRGVVSVHKFKRIGISLVVIPGIAILINAQFHSV